MYYFVEPMAEADIATVQEIERRSFTTPWSTQTYRQEIRSATSRYVVARASASPPPPRPARPSRQPALLRWLAALLPAPAERAPQPAAPIIGYGGVWLAVDEGHITTLAVSPEYRGRGIGALLLNGLIDEAFDLGAERLTLEVRVSNSVAQTLYRAYGFERVGERPRYYTDNGEDALLMTTADIRTPSYQERLRRLREQLYERLRRAADEPAPAAAPALPAR